MLELLEVSLAEDLTDSLCQLVLPTSIQSQKAPTSTESHKAVTLFGGSSGGLAICLVLTGGTVVRLVLPSPAQTNGAAGRPSLFAALRTVGGRSPAFSVRQLEQSAAYHVKEADSALCHWKDR